LAFVVGLPLMMLLRECPPPKLAWTMLAGGALGAALKFLQISNARLPLGWQGLGVSAIWGGLVCAAFWLAVIPGSYRLIGAAQT